MFLNCILHADSWKPITHMLLSSWEISDWLLLVTLFSLGFKGQVKVNVPT
jgi:hypothetical protein